MIKKLDARHFYAYKPREDGTEPLGSSDRLWFNLKSDKAALARARRLLGPSAVVWFIPGSLYDTTTHERVTG